MRYSGPGRRRASGAEDFGVGMEDDGGAAPVLHRADQGQSGPSGAPRE